MSQRPIFAIDKGSYPTSFNFFSKTYFLSKSGLITRLNPPLTSFSFNRESNRAVSQLDHSQINIVGISSKISKDGKKCSEGLSIEAAPRVS